MQHTLACDLGDTRTKTGFVRTGHVLAQTSLENRGNLVAAEWLLQEQFQNSK
jgi:hypothetical protein